MGYLRDRGHDELCINSYYIHIIIFHAMNQLYDPAIPQLLLLHIVEAYNALTAYNQRKT